MANKIKIGFRTKLVVFLTVLLFVIIGSVLVFLNDYFSDYLRASALDNFQVIAETGEGAYFAFTESLKIRAVDWGSDGRIRGGMKAVLQAKTVKEKDAATRQLGDYLREEKMLYDPSIVLVDILDKNGVVIVSSREDRIGIDELAEEREFRAHRFSETIGSGLGEAFVTSAISEPDEHMNAMIHVTTRIFSQDRDESGNLLPQDAVMLIHFDKMDELARVLSGEQQVRQGAKTGMALFEKYKSADIFLVSGNRIMVTRPRFDGVNPEQKIETLPVAACFDQGKEVVRDYVNHRGVHVYGASMCMARDNLVLVVEVVSDEVLGAIGRLQMILLIGGLFVFILGSLTFLFFTGRFLKKLLDISRVADEVARGNTKARAASSTFSSDEIDSLAFTFNLMLDNIEHSQKSLERANAEVREKGAVLAKKVEELEKFKDLTVGRELKMVGLKKEIEELKAAISAKP